MRFFNTAGPIQSQHHYHIPPTTENAIIAGGSAFNIRAESLRLGDFSRAEVQALLAQHTEETGQGFAEDFAADRQQWRSD